MKVLVTVLTIMVCGSANALPPEDIFAKASVSIVVVTALDEDGEAKSRGSGVVIAPGVIVTNCHVVDGATRIEVAHEAATTSASLRIGSTARDICLLQTVRDHPFDSPVTGLIGHKDLRVGQKVFAIGNPRGLELTMSQGIVSSLRKMEDGSRYVQTDASISPGSSGGGLFNEDGHLIGITSMYLKDSQNLNFAITTNWILDLLGQFGDEVDEVRTSLQEKLEELQQLEATIRAERESENAELEAARAQIEQDRARLEVDRQQVEAEKSRLVAALAKLHDQAVARTPSPNATPRTAEGREPAPTSSELSAIEKAIQSKLESWAQARPVTSARYRIKLFPVGYLDRVTLIESSGDPVFDQYAGQAIWNASPFRSNWGDLAGELSVVIGWARDHPIVTVYQPRDFESPLYPGTPIVLPLRNAPAAPPTPPQAVVPTTSYQSLERPSVQGPPQPVTIDRALLEQYSLLLSREVGKDGRYPERAQKLGWTGTTEVLVRMASDGRTKEVTVAKSSGHQILDEEAVEKVKRLRQLPVPPEGFRGREFTVLVPIVFRLE